MPEPQPKRTHTIGEKLQEARKKAQMSLRDLAGRADISASMLSQIETGKAYPSVRSIYSIAAALSVPVDFFFPDQTEDQVIPDQVSIATPVDVTASDLREMNLAPAAEDDPVVFTAHPGATSPIVHAAGRPTIELKGGVSWSRLTAMAEAKAEFLEISYAPGASSGAEMSHHEGREFGLVLSGELVIELGFEVYTLQSGDSIIFDSMTPHRLSNVGDQVTRAVWVVFDQRSGS